MPGTAKVSVLADANGNVLAVHFRGEATAVKDGGPSASLAAREGQRVHSIDVPAEVLRFTGRSLHAFFSQVKVLSATDVRLPRMKTVTKEKGREAK